MNNGDEFQCLDHDQCGPCSITPGTTASSTSREVREYAFHAKPQNPPGACHPPFPSPHADRPRAASRAWCLTIPALNTAAQSVMASLKSSVDYCREKVVVVIISFCAFCFFKGMVLFLEWLRSRSGTRCPPGGIRSLIPAACSLLQRTPCPVAAHKRCSSAPLARSKACTRRRVHSESAPWTVMAALPALETTRFPSF